MEKDVDVLFCGRIQLGKGSRAMVELCRRLVILKPDIRICIVGYGDDEAWVKDTLHSYANNMSMTGKVSFAETKCYYNRSRVYVSTSYHEGMPDTCLEPMEMRLPAVVGFFVLS